ncbi:MAG: hypothetical protein H0W50_00485 [Parachlamydiaceae bacterium]|nr:hypothetical protein [Parachlamydiaceae bacterium]
MDWIKISPESINAVRAEIFRLQSRPEIQKILSSLVICSPELKLDNNVSEKINTTTIEILSSLIAKTNKKIMEDRENISDIESLIHVLENQKNKESCSEELTNSRFRYVSYQMKKIRKEVDELTSENKYLRSQILEKDNKIEKFKIEMQDNDELINELTLVLERKNLLEEFLPSNTKQVKEKMPKKEKMELTCASTKHSPINDSEREDVNIEDYTEVRPNVGFLALRKPRD